MTPERALESSKAGLVILSFGVYVGYVTLTHEAAVGHVLLD